MIVRVQGPNSGATQPWGTWIKAALDAGADGVIVPQVRSADEVRTIVGACNREQLLFYAQFPLSRSRVRCIASDLTLVEQMTADIRQGRADSRRSISHSTSLQEDLGLRAEASLPTPRVGTHLVCRSTFTRQTNPSLCASW